MFTPQPTPDDAHADVQGLHQTLTAALLAASAGLLPAGLLLRGRAQ